MNLMKIDTSALARAIQAVDSALGTAAYPTKALVVRTLAKMGLCSPKSAGVEQTLLNAAKAKRIDIPVNFAKLMGVAPSPAPKVSTSTPVPLVPVAPPTTTGAEILPLFTLGGGVSTVTITSNGSCLKFSDGTTSHAGRFDVSSLGSNFNLLQLTES